MVDFDDEEVSAHAEDFLWLLWAVFMHRHGPVDYASVVQLGRFQAVFGPSPTVAAKAWILLALAHDNIWANSLERKRRFMWALLLMNNYGNEHQLAMVCGADEKTIRKWAWHFILELSLLEIDVVSGSVCSFSTDPCNSLLLFAAAAIRFSGRIAS